jgi:plastocyanin
MAFAACGNNNATPDAGVFPTVKLTTPAAGATAAYDADHTDLDVAFTVAGLTLMDPGKCGTTANCGHVELFIDGPICNDKSDPTMPHPYNHADSSSPTTAGLDYCPTFPMVDGAHTLKAELHKDDLSPILGADGKVISDSVSFTAKANAMADMAVTGPCGSVTNPITLAGMAFGPKDCKVSAGSVVHWTWISGGPHSVTSDPGSKGTFDSTLMTTGTYQFTVPATLAAGSVINYHCQAHGSAVAGMPCVGMCATLTVQ